MISYGINPPDDEPDLPPGLPPATPMLVGPERTRHVVCEHCWRGGAKVMLRVVVDTGERRWLCGNCVDELDVVTAARERGE